MRTVYLGTSDFAATVLDRLAASAHRPQLVVTRPDAPRGRGRKLAPPPVAERTGLLGIELFQPDDVNGESTRERIAAVEPEAVVICAYGALIKDPLLSDHELLNVHPSLLPRWRGAAPVERAIMAGDEQTGVTVHRTVKELDAGPWAAMAEFPIALEDTAGDVYARSAALAADLVGEALARQEFTPQPEEGATYAEKIGPADRELDWSRPPKELHDRIRALSPHIGARGELHGRRVTVWRSRLADGKLELLEVQPEGRRRMSYDEFLRGLR
jgi:methionyl-tRNA formyltransferase